MQKQVITMTFFISTFPFVFIALIQCHFSVNFAGNQNQLVTTLVKITLTLHNDFRLKRDGLVPILCFTRIHATVGVFDGVECESRPRMDLFEDFTDGSVIVIIQDVAVLWNNETWYIKGIL